MSDMMKFEVDGNTYAVEQPHAGYCRRQGGSEGLRNSSIREEQSNEAISQCFQTRKSGRLCTQVKQRVSLHSSARQAGVLRSVCTVS